MAVPLMQQGNQVTGAVATSGIQILGNNFSAGGNNIFNINAGPSTETIEAIRCKRSLFTTDPVDDRAAYISFKDEIITATFTWITKSQPYKSWVDRSTGSGIIWISGAPGTGKTMLSVFLTQELESVETRKALVLYYFCEGRDPKRNSPVHLLRALIYTLVQKRPSLMIHLLPDYEVRQESLFGPDAIEPLWRILMRMIEDPDTGDVYCIIDGLDECAKTSLAHLEHILKKFKGFYSGHLGRRLDADGVSSKFGQLSLSSGTGRLESGPATGKAPDLARPVFKTALISREDPECLCRELSAFQRLRLGKLAETGIAGQASAPFNKMNPPADGAMQMSLNGNVVSQSVIQGQTMVSAAEDTPITGYSESLSIYVRAKVIRLARNKGYNEKVQQSLQQGLGRRGDGTFLWVDMAVEQLAKTTLSDPEQALINLPNVTEGMYHLTLLQIPPNLVPVATFVLRWVATAFRPLKLEELSAVLYFTNGSARGPMLDILRQAVDCCGGFLDISEDEEVKLRHQTTKEFLTGPSSPLLADPRLQLFYVNEKTTHGEIAQTSISYLESSCFCQDWCHLISAGTDPYTNNKIEPDDQVLVKFPFIRYSAFFWPEHLKKATVGSVNFSSPFFSPGSQLRQNWFSAAWEATTRRDGKLAPLSQSKLHIAAFFDILTMAENLSRQPDFKVRLEKKNWELMTPLFVAAARGSVEVFVFLLDHGANQTQLTENILMFASRKGRLSIVKLLVDRGADVNLVYSENIAFKTTRAVVRLTPKKLFQDLAKIADKEDQNMIAVSNQDYGGEISVLHCAACVGHEEIARLLLVKGANIQQTTNKGWTAVHFAAWSGQVNVLELLQRHGGNVRAITEDGWTILHCAAWRGKAAMGEYLLDQSLHVDVVSRQMQTPLHLASCQGHEEMTRTLLSRGARIEAKTSKGFTPLHLAAAEGHDKVLKVLLEHGANRDALSNAGETSLKLAKGGRTSTTATLLVTYRPPLTSAHKFNTMNATGGNSPTAELTQHGDPGALPGADPQRIPSAEHRHQSLPQSPMTSLALAHSRQDVNSQPAMSSEYISKPTAPEPTQSLMGSSTSYGQPPAGVDSISFSTPNSNSTSAHSAQPYPPATGVNPTQRQSFFPTDIASSTTQTPSLPISQGLGSPLPQLQQSELSQYSQQMPTYTENSPSHAPQATQNTHSGAVPKQNQFTNQLQSSGAVTNTTSPSISPPPQYQSYPISPQRAHSQYMQHQQPYSSVVHGPAYTPWTAQPYDGMYQPQQQTEQQPYWTASSPAPTFEPPPTVAVDEPRKSSLLKGLISTFK